MDKYIGLDVGDVRIGVAKSEGLLSLPLEVIDRRKVKAIYRIKDILREENTLNIVIGLPLRLNGNSEIQVEKIKLFSEKLKSKIKGLKVYYEDERYTTKFVENNLKNTKKNFKEIREVVDMMAASSILQSFLDRKNKNLEEI